MTHLEEMTSDHVRKIWETAGPYPVTADEMIAAYMSPGSIASTLIADGDPVACGGIINIGWRRGEAWVLVTGNIGDYSKSLIKNMKKLFPIMAMAKGFRRVQATCHDSSNHLFKILGFEHEAKLHAFGPVGEDVEIHYRLFEVAK
jgi:hypothetical protein